MEELWSNVTELETHEDIMDCLKYGLLQWSILTEGDPLNVRASTSG
jgi:hypothetical protein